MIDSSGAAVGGATVTISNPATGFSRVLRTNEGGIYAAPALTPGAYTIRVEKEGFQSQSRAGVELQVGQAPTLNFTLAVGNVAEVIEVKGRQVDTERKQARTLEQLRQLARERGYNPRWAEHVYNSRRVKG